MQRMNGLVLCLMVLFLTGCDQESNAAKEEPVSMTPSGGDDRPPLMGEVVINVMDVATDQWGSDAYEIEKDANAPFIEDDTLTLTVSYSGGCASHDFTLVADDGFQEEADSVQLKVSVAHNANGDNCEAYLTEAYDFNLAPIKMLYQKTYGEDAGAIVLVLETDLDLVYKFES